MFIKQINGRISEDYIYRQKKVIAEGSSKIEELAEQLHNKELYIQMLVLDKMIKLHSEIAYAQNSLKIAEKVNQIKIFKNGSKVRFHQKHEKLESC